MTHLAPQQVLRGSRSLPVVIDTCLGLYNFVHREEGAVEVSDRLAEFREDWRMLVPSNEDRGAADHGNYNARGKAARGALIL